MAKNIITFIAKERGGCERMSKERMSFKRDYVGVYGYKSYERERIKLDWDGVYGYKRYKRERVGFKSD